ncbi:hypothetical protein, partial [Anaerotignum lactatifermentans]|uniref:hypothetical protein n=1 Tax=Anaerotignum lactatifermentans TaxID=160404 RepID=UPI001960B9DE
PPVFSKPANSCHLSAESSAVELTMGCKFISAVQFSRISLAFRFLAARNMLSHFSLFVNHFLSFIFLMKNGGEGGI